MPSKFIPLSSIWDKPTEVLKDAQDASRMVLENWWYSDRTTVDPQRDLWDEVYKMYRGYQEIADDEVLSNFHVPATWSHIESYIPRVAGARPRIEVWETEPNDRLLAQMHRALIFYDWRKLHIPFWLVPFVKAGLVFGAAAWRVRHRREVGMREVRVRSFLEDFQLQLVERVRGLERGSLPRDMRFETVEQVLYDDPVLEPLDLDRIYPHPDATSMEDLELRNLWMIDEEPGVEFTQIEAEAKANPEDWNQDAVRQLGKMLEDINPLDRYSSAHRTYLKNRQLETFGPEQIPSQDTHLRQVTLLRQQNRHKITKIVKEFPEIPPLQNRRNRIGMVDISVFTPIPDPMYSFYGQSLGEILFSSNLELDTLHNARMDHVLGAVAPMFGVLRGQGPAPNMIRWRPWGTIQMDGPEDLWPIQVPPMPLTPYREAQEIDAQMQKAAASNEFQGVSGEASGTATEASLLFQSAGSKAGLMYHILSSQHLERTGRLLIQINQLHKTQRQIVRLTGRQKVEIDPNLLADGFSLEPDLTLDVAQTEPMTRQFRLQRAVNALQTAGGIPPEAWGIPLVRFLGLRVLEGLDFEEAEDIINQMQQEVPIQQLIEQFTSQGGRSSQVEVRPETEGDRLAQDQGGATGPTP